MPLQPGQSLAHYRVVRQIGQGGMGAVYLAEDTKLDRQVALKVLPPEVAGDPERLARFTREAKAIAALSHPNIVTIHSVEEAGDLRFLAMEHVEGKTLDHLIPKAGMPVQKILEIVVPLADALAAAHDKGITHRDLKPGNVMVTETGRVKMLDFGLAKHVEQPAGTPDTQLPTEHVTKEGLVMGTLPYMSPEQAEGKPIDHRSDVFSLGVLLHEMAAGSRPFKGDTAAGLVSSILKDTPPSITDIRHELPSDLARILGRCLMKDPLERYQTARDVFNELRMLQRQIDSGQALLSGSSPAIGTALPRKTSFSLPAIAGVAAVVAALGLGGWWLVSRQEAEPSAPPAAPTAGAAPAAPAKRKMLVVLPFENLGEAEDDYFAAGVAEEIMSRLASVEGLGVISRKSAMSYAGTDKTIREIGEELGVGYVLEGTIRWGRAEAGASRVRITPQLIQVSDDTQIWSETYDRVIEDIFDVQSDIASQVAGQLGISLVEGQRAALSARPTDSVQAWQDYLKGLNYNVRYDFEGLSLAVKMFRQAVEADPEFVQAWAGLAAAHAAIMHFGHDTSEERDRQALEAARRALELDPGSPEAHVAMGYYHYHGHKRYEAALRQFEAAAKIRPGDPAILYAMALVLRRQGHWEESTRNLEEAFRLDPRNVEAAIDLGNNLLNVGRYREALQVLGKAESLSPDIPWVYFYQVMTIWLWNGDLAASRSVLERTPPGDQPMLDYFWTLQLIYEGDYESTLSYLDRASWEWTPLGSMERSGKVYRAWVLELMGRGGEARRLYEELLDEIESIVASGSARGRRLRSTLGMIYAGLGRKEEALREGRRSAEEYSLSKDAIWGPANIADLAWIQVEIGDLDGAFDTLEQLLSVPNEVISPAVLETDPRWAPLRHLPRYAELLGLHPGATGR